MKNFLHQLKFYLVLICSATMISNAFAQDPTLKLLTINPNGNAIGTTVARAFGGEVQKTTNGTYVFFANDGSGKQLWLTDGTTAGTQKLNAPSTYSAGYSDNATIKVYGNDIYVRDVNSNNKMDIVYYNSTIAAAQGVLVTPNSTNTLGFTFIDKAGNYLYFTDGTDLKSTDGTADGTVLLAAGAFQSGSNQVIAAKSGSTLYFKRTGNGTTNFELWKSEGTIASTVLVKRFDAPSSNGSGDGIITTIGDGTVFVYPKNVGTVAADAEWWRIDNGLPVQITNYGNFNVKLSNPTVFSTPTALYVAAATGTTSTATKQVWKLDANTANATSPIFDGSSNAQIMSISFKKYTNGKLYYWLNEGGYYKHYTTDGQTVEQFLRSGHNNNWIPFKGKEYAIQYDENDEWALFQTDGTLAGTEKLFMAPAGTYLKADVTPTVVGNKLVFAQGDDNSRLVLYTYDGGTVKAITGAGADQLLNNSISNFYLIGSGNAAYISDETNKAIYYTDGNTINNIAIDDVSPDRIFGSFAVNSNKLMVWLRYKTDPLASTKYTDFFVLNGELTLLVQLVSFTAKAENSRAKLQWETAQELNNQKFVIYRKGETGTFLPIGNKAGAGTVATPQNYTFYDSAPLNGTNYYKLAQVDNDGKETELGIKSLNFGLQTSDIGLKVYPNPIASGTLWAKFAEARGGATLSLLNVQGKTVAHETVASGSTQTSMNVGRLTAGVYVLVYNSGTALLTQKVIIK